MHEPSLILPLRCFPLSCCVSVAKKMPFRPTQRRECPVDGSSSVGTPVTAALLAMRAPVWVAVGGPHGSPAWPLVSGNRPAPDGDRRGCQPGQRPRQLPVPLSDASWGYVSPGESWVRERGGLLWCPGFPLGWLLLLWSVDSRRSGFSSCSSGTLERGLSTCGTPA